MVTPSRKSKKSTETTGSEKDSHHLVLHNDDINTFEYVIDTLCEVCRHNLEQAEQCAMITHYKGKCEIKKGTLSELKVIKNVLSERNLSVTIE
ncbi:MAG: ATP-dependent Clp protease adaptor ClpS [Chlorobi bacterium]|nr:ATP-dependent Clp protease adaptor ClpS [Chlorobiota bacterium]